MKKPTLSIVVIFHDMIREAERTLFSLSGPNQTEISDDDYEIITIDNGSTHALKPDNFLSGASNINHHFLETQSCSPAAAVNFGARKARGEFLAVIVDGARMATPGVVSATLKAFQQKANPFVCLLSWHLGPEVQNVSMQNGYCQVEEDRLLASVNWREDGYRLFGISTIAQSSAVGFGGGMPTECSYFSMRKSEFFEVGGFDERFQSPGGGLVNHDFLKRALAIPDIDPMVILGEGVFHQYHGGVATNVPIDKHPLNSFKEEYFRIHGEHYRCDPPVEPTYVGKLHPAALRFAIDGFYQTPKKG